MPRIAVLGAGVAGLTAADELSQRHFDVDVFERRADPGGKARSFSSASLPGLGQLPAEHGFRFIPGFYRHLPCTMSGVPFTSDSTVQDNLVEANEIGLLRSDTEPVVMPASSWGFLAAGTAKLRLTTHPFADNFGLTIGQIAFLARKLVALLGTCRERRLAECEDIDWLDYCGANSPSRAGAYRAMMVAMTRSLVAARAEQMSARTGGDILNQLQLAWSRPAGHPDRLLNGPTTEVWIDPWRQKLERAGVRFHMEQQVVSFEVHGKHLAAVNVRRTAGDNEVRALTDYDWYVCALPVDAMTELVDDAVKAAAPSLANLDKLVLRWMNGIMLYLRHDLKMLSGHSIYVDSPWALTSVSQAQFWPDHLSWREPGQVEGILSVDISDWDTVGTHVPKRARDCTPEEIYQEVIGEIGDHVEASDEWKALLDGENIAGYFIDPAIMSGRSPSAHVNLEPLLINTTDSWQYRPQSVTEIDNLVLAADYVRTGTDLACMEGANEAARRAVNWILQKDAASEPLCEIWPLQEPVLFSILRYFDRNQFRLRKRAAYRQAHEMLVALGIDR